MDIKLSRAVFFGALLAVSPVYAADNVQSAVALLAERLTDPPQGELAAVDGDQLYISLGQQQGVPRGALFDLVRPGEPIKIGDEIIGYQETSVGRAEALQVREKLSIVRMTDQRLAPQKGDRAFVVRQPVKRIVVAQFTHQQGFNQFTKSVQENFVTALINQGIRVVERDQLERVLAEQKLSYSGLVDLDSAQKVGRLLGAEGILLGTIGDQGDQVVVSSRLVHLESGDSIAAADESLPKTPVVSRLMARQLEKAGFSRAAMPANNADRVLPTFENKTLKAELLSLTRDDELYSARVRITAKIDSAVRLYLHDAKNAAYVLDVAGNQHPFTKSAFTGFLPFPSNTPRVVTLTFKNVGGSSPETEFTVALKVASERNVIGSSYITISNAKLAN